MLKGIAKLGLICVTRLLERCYLGRLVILVSLTCHSVAFCGGTQGKVSGNITDPSGAAIPHVAVTARNLATGTEQHVNANAQGFYAFTSLPVGEYEMVMRQPGFAEYRRTGILMDLDSALEVDATLDRRQNGPGAPFERA